MDSPVFIFLHGLLGNTFDWQPVIRHLPFECHALDLPGHGQAKQIKVVNFDDCCQYIAHCIHQAIGTRPYHLVGYSLGGRLALYYALSAKRDRQQLLSLVLEGVNVGLKTASERQARLQWDQKWASRFATEPLEWVLESWYQQPVFSHLTPSQRTHLITERKDNHGENIAHMLRATSLAKQPDFSQVIPFSPYPIYYFFGEKDTKFKLIAQQNAFQSHAISQAGHNAHKENPQEFSQKLTALFQPLTAI